MTVLRRGGNARGEGEDGRRRRKGENGWGHNDGHAAITCAVRVETAHNATALPYNNAVKCLHDGKPGFFHPEPGHTASRLLAVHAVTTATRGAHNNMRRTRSEPGGSPNGRAGGRGGARWGAIRGAGRRRGGRSVAIRPTHASSPLSCCGDSGEWTPYAVGK